ncbi:putative endosomal cargo receptor [Venturia nashicola]|uniref:Putative endosomal cargo receptor n=1 Tax=Venturia nashicola TaxID=86259 RepID=A0A4Z1NED8_9PEZI|nr:putative endosomal cargo receptor [Venturia nashicola]TLD18993.1 putative endosomal cargo receptor [Venturia nashicola]
MTKLRSPAGLSNAITYLLLALFALPTHALYFYMKDSSPKCFHEELPKDTLVVGHYTVSQYDQHSHSFSSAEPLGLYITVEEVFDSHHRIVAQKGDAKGRFTFSAADSGEHRLCFSPTNWQHLGSYMLGGEEMGGLRVELDMAIGETSAIESTDKSKMEDLVTRVRDLNGRLGDVRREQVFQREREAEFRDQSESTNSKIVRYTIIQLVILGATCAWQLSHLRSFFIKQKLT